MDSTTDNVPVGQGKILADSTAENPSAKKGKVITGVFLAVIFAVGLYCINRFWIAPATIRQAHAGGINSAGRHPVAPDFTLAGIHGEKVNLSDYKGKVVMIDFWATWCGPCRVEIPEFVELQNRYRDQGLVIIGISKDDSPEPVRDFYKEYKMNYPVAMEDDSVDQLYGGIFGLPTTFLIGRDGHVYAKHNGAADISVFDEEIRALLAAKPGTEVANFQPATSASSADIEVKSPAQVKAEQNPDVPGVDLSALTAVEITQLKVRLKTQPCTCGCNMSVLECRHKDPGCGVSRSLARTQVQKLAKKSA